LNKVNRVSRAARLPQSTGKYDRKNRIAHAGFAMTVYFICESSGQAGRTIFHLRDILDPYPAFVSVILGPDTPLFEIRLIGFDIYGIQPPTISQPDAARVVRKIGIDTWLDFFQGGSKMCG